MRIHLLSEKGQTEIFRKPFYIVSARYYFVDAPYTLLFGGLGCILGAIWFATSLPALRRDVRPIYVKIDILPEVAAGIQNSSELSVPPET